MFRNRKKILERLNALEAANKELEQQIINNSYDIETLVGCVNDLNSRIHKKRNGKS